MCVCVCGWVGVHVLFYHVCVYVNTSCLHTGVVSTLAGGGSPGGTTSGYLDGFGTSALFRGPSRIDVDASGVLFVMETFSNRVRMISPTGKICQQNVDLMS